MFDVRRPHRGGGEVLRLRLPELEDRQLRRCHAGDAEDEEARHRGAGKGLPGQRRRLTEKPKLTLERTFQASIDEVWELWTTKDGIESWWGPEGFSVVVRDLDLRPGHGLAYTMSATAPEMIDYMRKAGMPVANEHSIRFTQVDPPRRLA